MDIVLFEFLSHTEMLEKSYADSWIQQQPVYLSELENNL